jgi:hypothetical protein
LRTFGEVRLVAAMKSRPEATTPTAAGIFAGLVRLQAICARVWIVRDSRVISGRRDPTMWITA